MGLRIQKKNGSSMEKMRWELRDRLCREERMYEKPKIRWLDPVGNGNIYC